MNLYCIVRYPWLHSLCTFTSYFLLPLLTPTLTFTSTSRFYFPSHFATSYFHYHLPLLMLLSTFIFPFHLLPTSTITTLFSCFFFPTVEGISFDRENFYFRIAEPKQCRTFNKISFRVFNKLTLHRVVWGFISKCICNERDSVTRMRTTTMDF
jgi:hypothetical protein